MDLTFQVPMQYCSLQHRTLLLPPVTSTAGYCFCFGSIPSFFLELFLHWSPVAYWTPTDLGNSYFSILSFCLFILFMGFSRQEYLAPSFGEGNGNPLQCSCLENPRDRGAWWAVVSGVTQSRTQLKQLSSSSREKIQNLFQEKIVWAKKWRWERTQMSEVYIKEIGLSKDRVYWGVRKDRISFV